MSGRDAESFCMDVLFGWSLFLFASGSLSLLSSSLWLGHCQGNKSVSMMLESFVDLINMAKLDWFCLKWGSCCALFCSDPSERGRVFADLLLLPQELGLTPELGPLCSPTLCHPSWPKSVGAFLAPSALQFYKCGFLVCSQPGSCHTGRRVEPGCPAVRPRTSGEDTFKVLLWQRCWHSEPAVAWPGCLLCLHIRVMRSLQHHSVGDWGGAPCTSGISHCWRRNYLYTPSGWSLFLWEIWRLYPRAFWNVCFPSMLLGARWSEAPTWHMGCAVWDPICWACLGWGLGSDPSCISRGWFWCSSCTWVWAVLWELEQAGEAALSCPEGLWKVQVLPFLSNWTAIFFSKT